MQITIRLVGMLRLDRFKQRAFDVPEGASVSETLKELSVSLEQMKICLVSINGKRSKLDAVLKSGDVLEAFLPVGEG